MRVVPINSATKKSEEGADFNNIQAFSEKDQVALETCQGDKDKLLKSYFGQSCEEMMKSKIKCSESKEGEDMDVVSLTEFLAQASLNVNKEEVAEQGSAVAGDGSANQSDASSESAFLDRAPPGGRATSHQSPSPTPCFNWELSPKEYNKPLVFIPTKRQLDEGEHMPFQFLKPNISHPEPTENDESIYLLDDMSLRPLCNSSSSGIITATNQNLPDKQPTHDILPKQMEQFLLLPHTPSWPLQSSCEVSSQTSPLMKNAWPTECMVSVKDASLPQNTTLPDKSLSSKANVMSMKSMKPSQSLQSTTYGMPVENNISPKSLLSPQSVISPHSVIPPQSLISEHSVIPPQSIISPQSVISPSPQSVISPSAQSMISPSAQSVKSPSSQNAISPSPQSVISPHSVILPSAQSVISPSAQSVISPSAQSVISPAAQSGISPSQQSVISPSPQNVVSPSPQNVISQSVISPSPQSVISPSPQSVISPSPQDLASPVNCISSTNWEFTKMMTIPLQDVISQTTTGTQNEKMSQCLILAGGIKSITVNSNHSTKEAVETLCSDLKGTKAIPFETAKLEDVFKLDEVEDHGREDLLPLSSGIHSSISSSQHSISLLDDSEDMAWKENKAKTMAGIKEFDMVMKKIRSCNTEDDQRTFFEPKPEVKQISPKTSPLTTEVPFLTKRDSCEDEVRALSCVSSLSQKQLLRCDEDGDYLIHMLVIKHEVYLLKAFLARLEREGLLKGIIDVQNKDMRTALYFAVEAKSEDGRTDSQEEIIKLLIDAGANVSVQSCHSRAREVIYQSPLHLAASLGQHRIVNILLKSDTAEVNSKNSILETPVHCAVKKYGFVQKNYQNTDYQEVLKILKKNNANFAAKTKMNKTVLHMAAEKGDDTLMNFLLNLLSPSELSTIINEQDDNGDTALHIASGLELRPTVERVTVAKNIIRNLLSKRADERIKNRRNKTAYNFLPKSELGKEIGELFRKRTNSNSDYNSFLSSVY